MAVDAAEGAAAATSSAAPSVSHVPGLDGARALAALLVLVFHAAEATGQTAGGSQLAYALRPWGALGVSIFFVISGFLLYRPFVTAHLQGEPQPPIDRYLVRRALRIFPAYWLAFVVFVYVFGDPERTVQDLGDLVTLLTLQQGYDADKVLAGVPVAWTLTIEVTFYAFLPLFAVLPVVLAGRRASSREQLRIQLVSVAGLFVLATVIRFLLVDGGATLIGIFPAMADWFAAGMLLAVLRAWFDLGHEPPRVIRAVQRRPELGLIPVALAYVGVLALRLEGGFTRMALGDHMARNALFVVIGVGLIGPLALGASTRRPLLRALGHPVVRWFGVVSYGVYLWHTLVIRELRPRLVDDLGMGTGFWPALVLTLAGTAVLAAVSWYVLERPIINWGRRRERR
ncbi:MAG TPA: acyltransferase, partial [Acidimicrobiales bacterium]|nr:acyltransferase [Acidimicrobiales bacterium]